jgi:spore cortex biosynthesis protein YabQ
VNAASQWTTIGWMILCGAAMGAVFDLYRAVSHRFSIPRWLVPALDLVYWAAATFSVYSVLLARSHGEVRLYVFLGLGIGISGYFGLLSSRFLRIFGWLLDTSIKLARALWRGFRLLLVSPVVGLVRLLAAIIDFIFIVTAAILIWTFRTLAIPFKPLARKLWRLLLPLRRKIQVGLKHWTSLQKKVREIVEIFRKKS